MVELLFFWALVVLDRACPDGIIRWVANHNILGMDEVFSLPARLDWSHESRTTVRRQSQMEVGPSSREWSIRVLSLEHAKMTAREAEDANTRSSDVSRWIGDRILLCARSRGQEETVDENG